MKLEQSKQKGTTAAVYSGIMGGPMEGGARFPPSTAPTIMTIWGLSKYWDPNIDLKIL